MNTNMFSLEAEQSVLGGLMYDEKSWDIIGHTLKADDFWRPDHRAIYSACEWLASAGRGIDAVTISELLRERGLLDKVGGTVYLGDLLKSCPGTYNLPSHAKIISERAIFRKVHAAYDAARADLDDTSQPIAQRAYNAVNRITDAIDAADTDSAIPLIRDSAKEWIDYLERTFETGSGMVGMPTGFADIDKTLKGLCPGELIVIGARPSMGKSAFALNICANVANAGHGVFVTSLEMPKTAVLNRLAAYTQKISYESVRMAKMDDIGPHIAAFGSRMQSWNMAVDDRPSMDLNKLEASLRHHKRKYGLSLAMIDYLGLMNMPDGQNRAQAVADLTRGLKVLAGSLDIPIILLAQLNRKLEDRADKRPTMADLRDSGAIEQDAHTILFLYRDSVYNPQTKYPEYTECIIGKARDSERGLVIPLATRLDMKSFGNVAWDYMPEDWRK